MGTRAMGAALAAMTTASVVHGQTRVVYVDQSAPAGGDGSSWQTAYRDLRAALSNINAQPLSPGGLEVRLSQGIYRPPAAGRRDIPAFQFAPQASSTSAIVLSIQGGFAGLRGPNPDARDFVSARTVLSADAMGNDSGVPSTKSDNSCAVLGLSASAIRPLLQIGGIEFEGASPVAGVNVHGGAVFVSSDYYFGRRSVLIEDCVFRDNEANSGGALHLDGYSSDSQSEVRRCTFIGNRGAIGGAILVYSYGISIADCTFIGNASTGSGGAIYAVTSGTAIVRCRFLSNDAAEDGGGIYGRARIDSCLLAGNHAGRCGGAAYLTGNYTLHFSTLVQNRSAWGGGLFIDDPEYSVVIEIESSLFHSNRATVGGDQLAAAAPFPQIDRTEVEGGLDGMLLVFDTPGYVIGRDVIDLDPLFADPDGTDNDPSTVGDNDYHLSARSPLRDRGLADGSISLLDLDLNLRTFDGVAGGVVAPDLGCYESQVTLCPADIDADQGISVSDLVEFLAAFEAGGYLGDVTGNGTTPDSDGAVTIDDLLYFLARFELGC